MIRDNRRPVLVALAAVTSVTTVLVIVGVVVSRLAQDSLRRPTPTELASPARSGASRAGTTLAPRGPLLAPTRRGQLSKTGGPPENAGTVRRVGAPARAKGVREPASPPTPLGAGAAPTVAPTQGGTPASPPPSATGGTHFAPPTVVAAAVTSCTVSPAGGGRVTYSVTFRGGSAWAPAANFRDGSYTVDVVGGTGANSGLNAVIAGAPIEDTADGVPSYVPFPASLVLDARC